MNHLRLPSIVLTLFFCASYWSATCQSDNNQWLEKKFPIIPIPKKVVFGKNEIFFSKVNLHTSDFEFEASVLKSYLNKQGINSDQNGLVVEMIQDHNFLSGRHEAYRLIIDDKIQILSSHEKGAFYAVQTLKQLLQFKDGMAHLPRIEVEDWPAFEIRGFMHDTGRNFQSVDQLKEQIEIMAFYKYNVFHWHLTDNPGWRLESKIYPELQSEQAFSRHSGLYYTQEEFKQILNFCKERHITVIPEFDIPGHSLAFRKAFDLETMRDPRVPEILKNLFNELCELADKDSMPYIHIGTDEVRNKEEYLDRKVIKVLMDQLYQDGREVIVWKEGIIIKEDHQSINQLWAYHEGREGHRFIDSRSNYINHLDPFAGMSRLFFQQPCRQPEGDEMALGGILCAWPDNNTGDQRNVLIQNPIYSSMVFYSEAIWNGKREDKKQFWAKLPEPGTTEHADFRNFENKVINHRNRFFLNKEFQYVAQSNIQWKLLGPLDHKDDFTKAFEIENEIKPSYQIEDQELKWEGPYTGATIHLNHFFGFPSYTNEKRGTYYAYSRIFSPDNRVQDFWVGFQGWSRSGRRGGPTPSQGNWHRTNPKIWVNGEKIAPPVWKQPGLDEKDSEIPYEDEDYFYREPAKISLKKGWNEILLKIPKTQNSWKWMFTCVPINIKGKSVREVKDLKFDTVIDK